MAAAPLSPTQAERWTRIGVLCAIALLLGYTESFVPLPIPGVKLGLANIPVLVALQERDLSGAAFVALIKVGATGLLFGNPVTLAYSLVGTALAVALMSPLALLPTMRIEMVSVVGALAHEAGQLLVAQALLGTPLVWYGAPVLALAGLATGLLCGVSARKAAQLLREAASTEPATPPHAAATPAAAELPQAQAGVSAVLLCAGYLALVIVAMHAQSALPLLACVAASLCLCLAAHLGARGLAAAIAPSLPIALCTLCAHVLTLQQGSTLATLGPLAITREALEAAACMGMRLVSISCASTALVALVGRGALASYARRLLAPLRILGLQTAGPELAFSTTLALIAQLAADLAATLRPREVWTRAFWIATLPQLVQSLYQQALLAAR